MVVAHFMEIMKRQLDQMRQAEEKTKQSLS
jgi:hypothetical protein